MKPINFPKTTKSANGPCLSGVAVACSSERIEFILVCKNSSDAAIIYKEIFNEVIPDISALMDVDIFRDGKEEICRSYKREAGVV